MATNRQRREATRQRIVAAAREHFANSGYDETHTDSILATAGVSRGAMYHHFTSKQDVFEAVFIAVVEETITLAGTSVLRASSPIEDLIQGCLAWLHAARQPGVATILLDQGPQVLGWKRARDIEAKRSLAPMKRALHKAIDAGEISVASVELTALLLNALLAEVALVSVYQKRKVTLASQEATIRQFIAGLRQPIHGA
ncbi:MAG: TetR/AcrR family transcriptional regulator [Pseudomonadota bacterium]